jgi:hypothetical protein
MRRFAARNRPSGYTKTSLKPAKKALRSPKNDTNRPSQRPKADFITS